LPQSKIGEKAADAIFYVIQHADEGLIKKYLPALKRQAAKKEAETIHAAMMEDRLLMYEGKKQIYGSQGRSTRTTKLYIWPIQNSEKVNQLRKKAGFDSTIEEYVKKLGASYNPAQKLPDNEK